jgi:hypothetical protein
MNMLAINAILRWQEPGTDPWFERVLWVDTDNLPIRPEGKPFSKRLFGRCAPATTAAGGTSTKSSLPDHADLTEIQRTIQAARKGLEQESLLY